MQTGCCELGEWRRLLTRCTKELSYILYKVCYLENIDIAHVYVDEAHNRDITTKYKKKIRLIIIYCCYSGIRGCWTCTFTAYSRDSALS